MQRVMLESKIHRATVTDCDLHRVSCPQYDEADRERYEPRVVHVGQGTNSIIDVDAAVATLLS
jgi:aspartate 1-decarboxylase